MLIRMPLFESIWNPIDWLFYGTTFRERHIPMIVRFLLSLRKGDLLFSVTSICMLVVWQVDLLVFVRFSKQPTIVLTLPLFHLTNKAGLFLSIFFTSRHTTIPGNYLREDHLYGLTRQFVQPYQFLFQSAVHFILAPTTFCIRPSAIVRSIPTNISLSFSWLDSSISSAQLRCVIERTYSAPVLYVCASDDDDDDVQCWWWW